jgi:hypothetical protein
MHTVGPSFSPGAHSPNAVVDSHQKYLSPKRSPPLVLLISSRVEPHGCYWAPLAFHRVLVLRRSSISSLLSSSRCAAPSCPYSSSFSSPLTLSSPRVQGLSYLSMEYAAGHPVPQRRAEPPVPWHYSDQLLSKAVALTSSSASRLDQHAWPPRLTHKILGPAPHQIPFRSPLTGLTVSHVIAGGQARGAEEGRRAHLG